MIRITTRYVVRNSRHEELLVPSLADLHALYVHGFILDGDLVRQERSQEWVKVARFAALQGVRERRAESPAKVAMLVAALMAVALGLGLIFAR
jgi:hypothetical protein